MASQQMVTKVDSVLVLTSQPAQGQSIDTGTNRYVSKAVDNAKHADDEKEAGESGGLAQ